MAYIPRWELVIAPYDAEWKVIDMREDFEHLWTLFNRFAVEKPFFNYFIDQIEIFSVDL